MMGLRREHIVHFLKGLDSSREEKELQKTRQKIIVMGMDFFVVVVGG